MSEQKPRTAEYALVILFLTVIFSVPLIELALELRRGESPRVLEIFHTRPKAANLRAYERDLEEHSRIAGTVRPWVQKAQFDWFRNGGEKALLGDDGWLFYRPGLLYLTQRPTAEKQQTSVEQVSAAIASFRDKLTARGIQLVVMPAPNKESIYPEKLLSSHQALTKTEPVSLETRELFDALRRSHVLSVDLFGAFLSQKAAGTNPLYLAQDSHWSPEGIKLAARVAARLLRDNKLVTDQISCAYTGRTVSITRHGDVLRMLRVPQIEADIAPEAIQCRQVLRTTDGALYADNPDSEVLVLGDSFLRIFQQDETGGAGFIAHLAKELGQPVASIVNDGGASTLVRQELFRRPALLLNKKVVIWEFVERDIRYGTEGWQDVPLPPPHS